MKGLAGGFVYLLISGVLLFFMLVALSQMGATVKDYKKTIEKNKKCRTI